MRKFDVSVIIPVYKAEKYLDKCMNSVLGQTFKNLEVILVDDGSPDNCPAMCDEFALADSRVRVIHRENGGASAARNDAMKVAAGEYLLFVDADDHIVPDAVEKLFDKTREHKPDVVIGRTLTKNIKKRLEYEAADYEKIWTGPEFLKRRYQIGRDWMVIWISMYRREFILENNLFFKEGYMHEDELWVPSVLLNASRIRLTDISFYFYNRDNPESVMRKADRTQNGLDFIEICRDLEVMSNKISDPELKKLFLDHIARNYIYAVIGCGIHGRKYKKYVDNNFLKGKASSLKTRIKVLVFYISKWLYRKLYVIHRR